MSLHQSAKKWISLIVVLALSLSILSTAWASSSPAAADDLKGHWAETQMRDWINKGLLKGDNGSYYPNRPITRAELITLINNALKLTEKTEIQFQDLKSTHWAYAQVAIAVKAGYAGGYSDHTIRPDQAITREESAVMVAKALQLAAGSSDQLAPFKDLASVAEWSKPAVAALVSHSIIRGDTNGNLAPKAKLTRAEAVTMLNQATTVVGTATVYSKAGVYGPETGTETLHGDVVVSSPDVTLRNLVIEGNLTLTEGVGEGEAYFKKVTVKGTTKIQGGGQNSVHFEDSVLVRIIVDKRTGTVRVVAFGDSSIDTVVVNTPVKLEEAGITDSGFKNVELSSGLPSGSQVQLQGQFENVAVLSSDIKVSIPSGSVKQFNVGTGAADTEIDLGGNASIARLVLDAVAKLLGPGTIDRATVNGGAQGSTFETRPKTVDGPGKEPAIEPVRSTPNSNPDSGNPGGGSNNNQTCTGTAEACRDAHLAGLSFNMSTLNQLDANYYTTGQTGFAPDVFAYSAITPGDLQAPEQASVSVTKSVYSKVYFVIMGNNGEFIRSDNMVSDQAFIDLTVKPGEDKIVYINVRSGDGLSTKEYRIYIQHPRTLQEAVKIGSTTTYSVQNGTTVTSSVYHLEIGTIAGDRIRSSDKVTVTQSGNQTVVNFTGGYSQLPGGFLAESGTLHIKITRNGQDLAEGDYPYDLSDVPTLTPDLGVNVRALTKQELKDAFRNSPGSPEPYSYAYRVYLDVNKLQSILPAAQYFALKTEFMGGQLSSLPGGLSREGWKVKLSPNGYPGYVMTNATSINSSRGIDQPVMSWFFTTTDKQVNDAFVRVAFYNANMEVIGQTVLVLQFDDSHVADGYIPQHNWVPAQP
ncbi:S-layer protein [Cohnella sp. CFH 77786]|uniref:S-layer homology domain-containing protein n=1 Tax=Cohnella sp. CFH 77786 TaxID=2662265 RepID=UPI001C60EFF8|nr:S-layer homology domain-containing protein [Cohnella sp. CFH 77786]MBW5448488.1 S-layer protein [Cohnella sp. CFH 77786]